MEDKSGFSQLQVLLDLGLTLKQARVYSALGKSGISSVSAISRTSKVARPDAYKVLRKLNKLGLVEEIITKPLKYRAIPIKKGLEYLLRAKTNEYKKVLAETQIILDSAEKEEQKSKHVAEKPETPEFVLIPKGTTVIERIKTAIETAQQSIDVALSWKRFSRGITHDFAESIERAWAQKIKVRILLMNHSHAETARQLVQFCREKPCCQIRYISGYPETIFGIYDKKEISIATESKAGLKDSTELWSRNTTLLGMANQYFEILWVTAKEEPSI